MYYDASMAKAKVTLTLDAERLDELRQVVGARRLSAAVDNAVAAYLARLRHLTAVDEWLVELGGAPGPVPTETLERAAQMVVDWSRSQPKSGRKAG